MLQDDNSCSKELSLQGKDASKVLEGERIDFRQLEMSFKKQ